MLTNDVPYKGKSEAQVVRSLLEGTLPTPPDDLIHRPLLDQRLWSLCQDCWLIDPSSRLTSKQIENRVNLLISLVSSKINPPVGFPNMEMGIHHTDVGIS